MTTKTRKNVDANNRANRDKNKEKKRKKHKEYMRKWLRKPKNKNKKRIWDKKYRKKNKEILYEKRRLWGKKPESKIKRKGWAKKFYSNSENKRHYVEQRRKHRMKPEIKKQRKEYNQKYYAKSNIKERNNAYFRKYFNSSIERKLSHQCTVLIARTLKKHNLKKTSSTKLLIDYTIQELKKHLEKQFTPKMNWKNYGKYWEIDHKIPRIWFHFKSTKDKSFKICWSLENLQPLKKETNHSKQDNYADITPYHFKFLEE
jgi:hypothetical protein